MKEVSTAFVLDIINRSDKIEVSQEQLKDSLPELGMDSITFIQIVVALEEEFECEIPDSYLILFKMNTLNKIKTILEGIYADNHEK